MSCPSFAIGIVAHESRLDQAKRLADKVHATTIQIDTPVLRLGCERNHVRCWEELAQIANNAEWLVVLEDDAQPVHGFRDQLTQALAVAPAPYVSLYFGRSHPVQWQKRYQETIEAADLDTCWAMTSGWLNHAVGLAIRADVAPGMLAYLNEIKGKPHDEAIGQHARNTRQQIAYTLPSLVDHADLPTINVHQDAQPRTPGRKAWTIGTRPQWNSKTIEMG